MHVWRSTMYLRWGAVGVAAVIVLYFAWNLGSAPSWESVATLASNHVRLPEAADPAEGRVLRFQQARLSRPQAPGDGLPPVAMDLHSALGRIGSTVVHPPFLLAGSMERDELERWYWETIAPAVGAIAFRYLSRLPDQPVTVLLFRDEASYRAQCRNLFGTDRVSAYGFYSPPHRALAINLETGAGTLVHELTHALVDADFPGIPDWFNEGFASLHEECRLRQLPSGPWLEGLPNWRLTQLLDSLQRGELRTVRALVTQKDFRGERLLLNYAHARYVCLFLQKGGVLEEFYRRFRDAVGEDASGEYTLLAVLARDDWHGVESEFRAWIAEIALRHTPSGELSGWEVGEREGIEPGANNTMPRVDARITFPVFPGAGTGPAAFSTLREQHRGRASPWPPPDRRSGK